MPGESVQLQPGGKKCQSIPGPAGQCPLPTTAPPDDCLQLPPAGPGQQEHSHCLRHLPGQGGVTSIPDIPQILSRLISHSIFGPAASMIV